MSWDDRSNWPSRTEQALADLAARGIEPPAAVTAAVKVLRRVEAAKPATPTPTAIREAYLAGADHKQLDTLVLADLGAARMASEWGQARIDAAGAVLAAIHDAEPVLMPLLAKQAEAAITSLVTVADLGAGTTLDGLVRAGRTDDARRLAEIDTVTAELNALYEIRDRFLARGGGMKLAVNGVDASRWRDPERAAAVARGGTAAERYLAGLRGGLSLWYPSPSEAIKAATVIADRRAAEAKRQADREFGVGNTAFIGA